VTEMFDYTICNQADSQLFHKQCDALERNITDLKRSDFLEDVDGTLVRKYEHPKGTVTVKNDLQVDALYVISDFDLSPYFS
jgi:hypothetical protein